MFHVSLLKTYNPRPDHILNDEQVILPTQGTMEICPDCILETQERNHRNRVIREHLVQWKDIPTEEATWEDEGFVLNNYP